MSTPYLELREALAGHYDAREARAIALLVLEEAFGVARLAVYADSIRPFSPEEMQLLQRICVRLQRGEPVQHVLGRAPFCGMNLKVTPATLIPRPETEELVELAATLAADIPHGNGTLRIVDGGTGSGCIAIALSKRLNGTTVRGCSISAENPTAVVEGWDISAEVLAVARENAAEQQAAVCFRQADLLNPPAEPVSFHLLVSNPPYVCERERSGMEHHVLDFEPATALFVPDSDPLRFYRALARLAAERLAAGGAVAVEINRAFGAETAALFTQTGLAEAAVHQDCFGCDRFVTARKV